MKCRVANGYAEKDDIVTILHFCDEKRYLYKITGFQHYEGKPQLLYKKLVPETLKFFPDSSGLWMDFSEAQIQMKIIHKKKRMFGKLFGK